ncbi:nickel/cobalt efflux protein RcnA [Pandoraea nosoerga]|uniref:nickel/cobalt efflux protein RcnA n=1 Tax=Pandoraea nosoerga TaxID=2508296 RepID=UPI00197EEDEA|nr:nickel/cobalt efflux protein RcnA [Pandoraea nosoerga]MBN4667145.1 nickel/cobalt efflux protein RcnA [Pandoraea nosoerga]MBN4677133.1 nickel/cobalt efflux protein RcnA [Pandoraea nosoerga]MBN4681830.1 nickel/cobalt efflux protein RcnA [Pandoraea nosoerga]MBN4746250.1 nickel/cobalt efflux protein RcnA [Pandoraea nosoerga]
MTEFSTVLQQGNAWLFVPSAILLGALHGLEPGHSKTMMAAFIVAIRGTVGQAVLLGLSATLSHTAVVWLVAVAGMYFGRHWNAEATEPYFQLASGALILLIAAWMLWRTWRDNRHGEHGHSHDHDHGHDHNHNHNHDHAHDHDRDHAHDHHDDRADAGRHAVHSAHSEHSAHSDPALALGVDGYQDAHERAHARDIRKRFAGREVTTGQIVMFGLTGGLIPCPASITVLLLCLQLKRFALGAGLVLCFSLGLALTMVASGTLAALGVRHVSRRWSGFGEFARKAPYLSGILIVLVGLYVGYHGAAQLFFNA